ncbi:MAG: glycosyl hydrolase family 8 [Bacteroidota bacterium]
MHYNIRTLLFLACVFGEKFLSAQLVLRSFPQHSKYEDGAIIPNHVSQKQMDDSTGSFYNSWKESYINDDAGKGQYYIWTEGSTQNNICVSEGQGYGMMIVSLMAGYDTAAKKMYDGLFRYYKLHPVNANSTLMAWAQNKFFKNIDETSASDGDIDIAYSLLIANAQWGSKGDINYYDEARLLIAAIAKDEVNHKTYSILLSNAIEPDSRDYFDTRSSDFMPAHFKTFRKATNDTLWDKVIDSNYNLFNFLQKKYSSEAGLIPDFIQHINGSPIPAGPMFLESKYDGSYNYNACRVPWRIATDYIVNGDKRSKKIVDKINKWIKETTQGNPDNISAGYTLEGVDLKNRNFEAMSFISSFAVGAMTDKSNQQWLNKLWDYITGFGIDQYDYYDNSIKMLELIILSGNYWAPDAEK